MSISRQEEIIAGVWFCAAFLAFIAGFNVVGWIFTVKAAADLMGALFCAWNEFKQGRKGEGPIA